MAAKLGGHMSEANGKAKKKEPKILAGLDIGSSKVCFVVGQINEQNKIEVIGLGKAPSKGMRKGVVVDIEAITESIRIAKEEAELMAGYEILKAYVSIGGSHIKSFDSKGMVAITNEEIEESDIDRVINAAKAVNVPSDREVLHILPKEYKVDEQEGIQAPIGMSGVRLEASVHMITGGHTAIQNALKCCKKAGIEVQGLVLQQLASALSVLNDDEKKLGVAVVDMGCGTTDIIQFVNGSVSYTRSLPTGGQHVTNDVAVGLRTPQHAAEDVKKKYGCALASLVNPEENIEVSTVGGSKTRTLLRKHLCEVIEPRAEETLHFIYNEVQASGYADLLGAGIVLTGGASLLDGLSEMGEFVFDMPVRRGTQLSVGGLSDVVRSPIYSTAVGLLLYAQEKGVETAVKVEEPRMFGSFMHRLRGLFVEEKER